MPPDSILVPELPPRARRILQRAGQVSVGGGTTSACAENTFIELAIAGYIRNYLRVRGEYFTAFTQSGSCRELPPRARRIPPPAAVRAPPVGTTSACAENTRGGNHCPPLIRNYLRVRGEYRDTVTVTYLPHGTTSACAENTGVRGGLEYRGGNYLRVRGEYNAQSLTH